MKENQFLKAEREVTEILEKNIQARKSDQALFLVYWKKKAKTIPFKLFLLCPAIYCGCSFKTIERVRRKIQADRPELKDGYIADRRLEATKEYIQYSLNM